MNESTEPRNREISKGQHGSAMVSHSAFAVHPGGFFYDEIGVCGGDVQVTFRLPLHLGLETQVSLP